MIFNIIMLANYVSGNDILNFIRNPFVIAIILLLTGAWTGYITNDLAIKMLFKQYGFKKFKIGGVILNTRGQLEDSISELVEREIINTESIKRQLSKPEVNEKILEVVEDFFLTISYKHIEDVQLKDLNGFEETLSKVMIFIEEYLEENITEIVEIVGVNVKVVDVLSEKQISNFTNFLVEMISKELKKNNLVKDLIHKFYYANGDVQLNAFINKETLNVFKKNVLDIVDNLMGVVQKKYSRNIVSVFKKIYKDEKIQTLITDIEKAINNKSLDNFINTKSLNTLIGMFEKYLHTNESEVTIELLIESAIDTLKRLDKPFITLFSDKVKYYVMDLIKEQLPSVIDRIIAIVHENSIAFEVMIEDVIDEAISDKKTVKRTILSAVRKYLLDNITKKYDIVTKVIDYLESVDIEDLSFNITEKVIEYLTNKNISDFVVELDTYVEEYDVISSKLHGVLQGLVTKDKKIFSKVDLSGITVGEIKNVKINDFIYKNVVKFLESDFYESESTLNFIHKFIDNYFDKFTSHPINYYISENLLEDISIKANIQINDFFYDNKDKISEKMNKKISFYVKHKSLVDVLDMNKISPDNISEFVKAITSSASVAVSKIKELTTYDLITYGKESKELHTKTSNAIMSFIDSSLGSLIEGRIKAIVKQNLKKLSNEEILELMQDFMGRRLKPLTYLGALLGAIVGVLIGFPTGAYENGLTPYSMGYNVIIFAILGYLTNVTALFFIFRPYKPLFKMKFAQGIIIKQIPVFAKTMGKMVTEHLITEESINSLLIDNEFKMKHDFYTLVSDNDYNTVRQFLIDSKPNSIKIMTDLMRSYLDTNFEMLNTKFITTISEMKLDKLNSDNYIDQVNMIIKKALLSISGDFDAPNISVNTIGDVYKVVASGKLTENIEKLYTNAIEKLFNVESEVIVGKFIFYIDQFLDAKLDHKLQRYFSYQKFENSLEGLLNSLASSVLKGKSRVYIEKIISEKLIHVQETNTFGELFDGKLVEVISQKAIDYSVKIEEKIKEIISAHHLKLYNAIRLKIKENLGLIQMIGYTAVDGDELLKDIILRLVTQSIPEFIHFRMSNYYDILYSQIDTFKQRSIGSFNMNIDFDTVFEYTEEVIVKKDFIGIVNKVLKVNQDKYESATLSNILELLDVYSFKDLTLRFENELEFIVNSFEKDIEGFSNVTYSNLADLTEQIITKEIFKIKIDKLLYGLDKKDFKKIVSNTIEVMEHNKFIDDSIDYSTKKFISWVEDKSIPEVLDIEELKISLDNSFSKILNSPSLDDDIKVVVSKVVDELISSFSWLIEDKTKDIILDFSINSLFETISKHLLGLLNAVDFKEATEFQINSMEPKKIKKLFDSFASSYFRKLELYGLIGGVFAIYPVVVFSLSTYLAVAVKDKVGKKEIAK